MREEPPIRPLQKSAFGPRYLGQDSAYLSATSNRVIPSKTYGVLNPLSHLVKHMLDASGEGDR